MSMTINNNENMMRTYSAVKKHTTAFDKFVSQVVTGTKLKSAADDASGFSISERMRVQLHALDNDKRNIQNANALLSVTDEAVNNIVEELKSLKELAVMAANDTNSERDHLSIKKELDARIATIDIIANNTEYNNTILLNGTFAEQKDSSGAVTGRALHVHQGTESGQQVWLYLENMKTEALKSDIVDDAGNFKNARDLSDLQALGNELEKQEELKKILRKADELSLNQISLADNLNARVAMRVIEGALDTALGESTKVGAYQQRMEYNLSNVLTTEENVEAAESRFRDADMAQAVLGYTKNKFMAEASTSLLAQANQDAGNVIELLH